MHDQLKDQKKRETRDIPSRCEGAVRDTVLLAGSCGTPRPPFNSEMVRTDRAGLIEGSFAEDDFCTLMRGACEADSEGAIDGVLLCERVGGVSMREITGSSMIDSGRGGYAVRLVFCVMREGCRELAERGDHGLSGEPLPIPLAAWGGDIVRAADFGDSNCMPNVNADQGSNESENLHRHLERELSVRPLKALQSYDWGLTRPNPAEEHRQHLSVPFHTPAGGLSVSMTTEKAATYLKRVGEARGRRRCNVG